MRLFVIRPFGTKDGINFDRVDSDLIQPAAAQLEQYGFSISGGTTGQISRQGNIREDMFRMIVASDLVIADVSIHNANAFYELGIRHALRPRHTFLLRSKSTDPYPFDLQTDRYFLYDSETPASRIKELVDALKSTLASAERERSDSPVFSLLPDLRPHGRGQLIKVPVEFQEDVDRACLSGHRGDLRLLSYEAASFEWDQEALRLVGGAQLKLRAFYGARETFESLRRTVPDDVQANLKLGTIYQRLTLSEPQDCREELLAYSDQAIERVLRNNPETGDKVEALCLLGSNEKTRWLADFLGLDANKRPARALSSPHLNRMLGYYLKASDLNLNDHYSAINCLALLKTQIALAATEADIWLDIFDDSDKATASLKAREALASKLAATLSLALKTDEIMAKSDRPLDSWAACSRADLVLMTSQERPQRVEREYKQAIAGTDRFALEAMQRNLNVYKELGLFEPGLSAALQVVGDAITSSDSAQSSPSRVILFTGHMLDTPDRDKAKQRFPATEEAEKKARQMIDQALRQELIGYEHSILGIAGAACGGDILFHELCEAMGIQTSVYLALPEERFQVKSVQRGGPQWIERFRKITSRTTPRVLQQTEALPRWLTDKSGYDIWQRNNLWMMFSALAKGSRDLTLIALLNREREPDGPGGAVHLVDEALKWGFKVVELDARHLLAT